MCGFNSALITGATGFIGSALVEGLLNEGIEVFSLVRHPAEDHSTAKALAGSHIIEVHDFSTSAIYKALSGIKIDVVYNLAGYGVNPGDRVPELMMEGNQNILVKLLLAIRESPIKKFIHTGSCYEYGVVERGTYISEDHCLHPFSLYGAAKASAAIFGFALANELGLPFVTLRLFGVFGAGEAPHRLIPYLINRLENDIPVDLTPGEQFRDLLYIEDVVSAFLEAGRSDDLLRFPAYNVCSSVPVRIKDIGRDVAEMMKKPPDLLKWGKRSYRENEPFWLVGDNRRFRKNTNWRPRISHQDGIRKMIEAANLIRLQGEKY